MEYTNANQLFAALQKRVNEAMARSRQDALEEMRAETTAYYDNTKPVLYRRTYKLKNSPRTSNLSSHGDTVSFDAYLDTNYRYPSITYGSQPPSKSPSLTDVINLTNYQTSAGSSVGYLHPAIGRPHYWERANTRMRDRISRRIRSFFPA